MGRGDFRRGSGRTACQWCTGGTGVLVFAIIEGPDLGWWEPQSSFSILGWTWSENAPISPVPVALAVSAVGFALSAMAIGAFSPARQPPRRGTVRGRLAPCSSGSDWKPSASLSSSCLWGRIRMVGSMPRSGHSSPLPHSSLWALLVHFGCAVLRGRRVPRKQRRSRCPR